MDSQISPPTEDDEFEFAWKNLMKGLRHLYPLTKPKVPFLNMVLDVTERLNSGDEAAAWVDDYTEEKVVSKKLAHFIQSATAFVLQAKGLRNDGSNAAWLHLNNAYFVAGMAHLQMNAQRGADKKAEKYAPLKRRIMELATGRCPPEKWKSLPAMWEALEDGIQIANEAEGNPVPRDDLEAVFSRLTKIEEREFFLSLLAGPIKRGRPKKDRGPS